MSIKATGLLTDDSRPFTLNRVIPKGDLASFLEYFWIVEWSIKSGEVFTSVNIPYPCVHVVFEHKKTGIFGPTNGCYNKELSEEGFVIGARFKTGYFYPLYRQPITGIVDGMLDTSTVFSQTSDQIEAQINAVQKKEEGIDVLSEVLSPVLVDCDEKELLKAQLAYDITSAIESDQSLLRVDALYEKFDINARSLERLFKQYVGLSPKRVVRLFRLQQIANCLVSDMPIDWADLSASLGYFDQAHCIKDFKAFTGKTPSYFRHNRQ